MTDVVLQWDRLRVRIPTSIILSNFPQGEDLAYVPILPADAKEVIETREETAENLKLFK